MKRTISIILAVIMLLCTLGSISAFAADEKYPPLESGAYHDADLLNNYQYNVMGCGSEIFTFAEAIPISFSMRNECVPITISESEVNMIAEDYKKELGDSIGDVTVECYGLLSDGSMLLDIGAEFIRYLDEFHYVVIGKYVKGNSPVFMIYKDHEFSYISSELPEKTLDEVAEILHFAKFVDPNEQPITTEPVTGSASTPDTPAQNTSGNTTLPNNANGSIPTGQSSAVIILSILILGVSAVVFLTAKGKKKSL